MNLHRIYHWKALDSEIIDFEYHHDLTSSRAIIPSQTSKYAMRDGFMWIYDCIPVMRHVSRASKELRRNESKKGEARRAEQQYKQEAM